MHFEKILLNTVKKREIPIYSDSNIIQKENFTNVLELFPSIRPICKSFFDTFILSFDSEKGRHRFA